MERGNPKVLTTEVAGRRSWRIRVLDKLMTQKVSYVNKKKPSLVLWDT
jgi:hypothetical protein